MRSAIRSVFLAATGLALVACSGGAPAAAPTTGWAVDIALRHAMQERRHGVLVTQTGFSTYTVAVSRDVPYGDTREQRRWASMT